MIFNRKKRPPLFNMNSDVSRLLFRGLFVYILFYYGVMTYFDINLTNDYIRFSIVGLMLITGLSVFFYKFKKLTTSNEKRSFLRIVLMLIAFASYMITTGGGL